MLLNNGRVVPLPTRGLAELVPQMTTGYYYPDAIGLELERDFAMYGELYRRQPWIRAVVDKRADAVARLPVGVWNEAGDTRQRDTSSGYARLIEAPCSYLDNYYFWAWLASTYDIYGETYLAVAKDKAGKPVDLLPMHPTRVAVKRAPETGHYTYTFQSGAGGGDGLVAFDETEIVAFRRFNPLKLERGLSKLESLRSTVMSEDSSRNATSALWRNSGMPNMVLSSDKKLSPDAKKRLAESFSATHAGSSNAGRTLVLEEGLTAIPLQLDPEKMQMIEMRKLNREEVCGVYDIAPANVHILDHSTFSNVAQQLRSFYKDTMAPFIESIESVLDFYLGKYWTGQKVARFAMDEVLRGDFEQRADAVARLQTVGAMTPNESREIMGLTRYPEDIADKLVANSAIQVLGQPAERISMTGAIASDPDNVDLESPVIHVPSPTGGAGTDVPSPPQKLDPPKHLRAIKGAMGRGIDVREFAMKLAGSCPSDLEDILRAVAMAINERDQRKMVTGVDVS